MADASSSTLKDILNSSVLVALVTVVLGGIGGNYILHEYQEGSKDKQQELDDHKALVQRQEEVAISAFQLLGDAHYFAIALNKLAQPAPLPGLTPAQLETRQKSNELIWSRSADFLERWEKEKTATGMRLFFFYEGDDVRGAWARVKDAGDQMLSSALNRVLMHSPIQAATAAEIAAREAVRRTEVRRRRERSCPRARTRASDTQVSARATRTL
jgi:hypothetical protein